MRLAWCPSCEPAVDVLTHNAAAVALQPIMVPVYEEVCACQFSTLWPVGESKDRSWSLVKVYRINLCANGSKGD